MAERVSGCTYRFGRFELLPAERLLLAAGKPLAVSPRAFDLLLALVERAGHLVTKEEIFDLVWPDVVVEDNNIQVHVSAIRKLVGPEMIVTVPGRGYRFTARPEGGMDDVHPVASQSSADVSREATAGIKSAHSPLFGREKDLIVLNEVLRGHRVVSIVGPGGIGKTRLAQAVTRMQADRLRDGVRWIELASVSDPLEVVATVAAAIPVPVGGAANPRVGLLHGLKHRDVLLVLDNCEHVVAAVSQLVREGFAAAANVRWLITSREGLHLAEEYTYRLGGLAVPPPGVPAAKALEYGALALFAHRADAVDRSFVLSDKNVTLAVDICKRLDGIALAIEMAAARVALLGLIGIRDRLDERLRFLTRGGGVASRQHTLRATLDWSHTLLSAEEQAVFRRLAVFDNGCTLELAQAVTADASLDEWAVLEALGGLVDRSLLHVTGSNTELQPRYHLLETTRLYALEKLAEAGEEALWAERHGRTLAAFAKRAYDAFFSMPDSVWQARFEPEKKNFLKAMHWALEAGESELFAALLDTLWPIFRISMRLSALMQYAERAQTAIERSQPAVAAHLTLMIAALYSHVGSPLADAAIRAAVAHNRRNGSRLDLYQVLQFQARQLATINNAQDEVEIDRLLAEVRALEDASWPAMFRAVARRTEGIVSVLRKDYVAARASFLAASALYAKFDATYGQWGVRLQLVSASLLAGKAAEALGTARTLVAELRARGDHSMYPEALGGLCSAYIRQGALTQAHAIASEALPGLRRNQSVGFLFDALILLAARAGRTDDAARLAGYADAAHEITGTTRDITAARLRDETIAMIDAELGPYERERLMCDGARLTDTQADDLALR